MQNRREHQLDELTAHSTDAVDHSGARSPGVVALERALQGGGEPDVINDLLQRHRGEEPAMLGYLQQTCGNAFTQTVLQAGKTPYTQAQINASNIEQMKNSNSSGLAYDLDRTSFDDPDTQYGTMWDGKWDPSHRVFSSSVEKARWDKLDKRTRWEQDQAAAKTYQKVYKNDPFAADKELGLADARYFERVRMMCFRVLPSVTASEALAVFLKGPTLVECRLTIFVFFFETIRRSLGDQRFNQLFGPGEGKKPEKGYFILTPFGIKLQGPDGETDLDVTSVTKPPSEKEGNDKPGARVGLVPGGRYYFQNFRPPEGRYHYKARHPQGLWSGENAFYMGEEGGKQMWSGLGATGLTELEMMQTVCDAYNAPGQTGSEDRVYLDEATGKLRHMKTGQLDPTSGLQLNSGLFLDATKVTALAK
ncbi:MAG: hypothetical protein SFX73_39355 [Kofleriaceae bacterium]|nr:hypothetical protein [Kofleriaceae bacterium]